MSGGVVMRGMGIAQFKSLLIKTTIAATIGSVLAQVFVITPIRHHKEASYRKIREEMKASQQA
jgi:hypothetical protein